MQGRILNYISTRRELGVLFLVIGIYTIVSIIEPRFFSYTAVMNIMLFFPYLLVVAIGEMLEIVSRNVDISVGSILGFAAVVVGMTYRSNPELSLAAAFGIALSVGMVLGLINGLLVNWLKLPSVIITLGTMNLYRGLMFITVGARQIDNSFIPREVVRMSQVQHSLIGIPYTVLMALAIAGAVAVFINKTKLGREIYAVGSNPEAARLRGISLNKIRIIVFVLSGMLCGLGAMIYISRIGYINPGVAGAGLEFTAIAAVVIGGTSMKGGIGTILGTLLGCLLLGIINNAISIVGISGFWQEAIYGMIVILAIVLDRYYQIRLHRQLLVRAEETRTAGAVHNG
jgi:rhamnose transport system permease protein